MMELLTSSNQSPTTDVLKHRLFSANAKLLYRGKQKTHDKPGHIGFRGFESRVVELCNNALDDNPYSMAYLRRIECNLMDCEFILDEQLSVIADLANEQSEQWLEEHYAEFDFVQVARRKRTKHSALFLGLLHKLDSLVLHVNHVQKKQRKKIRAQRRGLTVDTNRAFRRILADTVCPPSAYMSWGDLFNNGLDTVTINDELMKIIDTSRAGQLHPIWLPSQKLVVDFAKT